MDSVIFLVDLQALVSRVISAARFRRLSIASLVRCLIYVSMQNDVIGPSQIILKKNYSALFFIFATQIVSRLIRVNDYS